MYRTAGNNLNSEEKTFASKLLNRQIPRKKYLHLKIFRVIYRVYTEQNKPKVNRKHFVPESFLWGGKSSKASYCFIPHTLVYVLTPRVKS